MKSLLMIAALIGISYSGIAQQKTTKHKSKTTHAKNSTKTAAIDKSCKDCETGKAAYTSKTVALGGREATWQRLLNCSKAKRVAAAKKAPAATATVVDETRVIQPSGLCYSYKKNNILVTECPDLLSAPGQLEMISEGAYGGYRPRVGTIATVNPVMAPQSPNVNNYRGPAPQPQSGNFVPSNLPPDRR